MEVLVPKKKKTKRPDARVLHLPRYHVIEMLMQIFRHSREKAFMMACEVDAAGRVIVDTTTKERAELKRDQIHAYGADWRIQRCKGSMSATIEPAEDGEE
jgi:ATP-dependent Clp protease adaptor protein ClpS